MAQSSRQAFANVGTSQTDSVLVSSIGQFSIKVVSIAMVTGSSATNITFNSMGSGAGTAISCQFQNGANGGAVLNRNEDGWFSTITGQSLTCTTGSGSTTGVLINYILI